MGSKVRWNFVGLATFASAFWPRCSTCYTRRIKTPSCRNEVRFCTTDSVHLCNTVGLHRVLSHDAVAENFEASALKALRRCSRPSLGPWLLRVVSTVDANLDPFSLCRTTRLSRSVTCIRDARSYPESRRSGVAEWRAGPLGPLQSLDDREYLAQLLEVESYQSHHW